MTGKSAKGPAGARPHTAAPASDAGSRIPEPSSGSILRAARALRTTVWQITEEEFTWQDAHYSRDSRYGREILFLIADSAWIRATSENIDVSRSDAIDTTIKIELDLSRIKHEAFQTGEGKLWLPLLVLPVPDTAAPSARPVGRRFRRRRDADDPDPLTSLTVADAHGGLLPMAPIIDVRHWISAALAEIIVNMAAARWAGPRVKRPIASRDQRLILSAAIYRLLRGGSGEQAADDRRFRPAASSAARRRVGSRGAGLPGPGSPGASARDAGPDELPIPSPDRAPHSQPAIGRVATAKLELNALLDNYIRDYDSHRKRWHGDDQGAERTGAESTHSFGSVLTQRAVQVLDALTQAVVIVVPVEREQSPAVVTIRLPARRLQASAPRGPVPQRAELSLNLLMPSADADRQVQINLPDGVSLEVGSRSPADLIVEVDWPQPLKDLAELMRCLVGPDHQDLPPGGLQCLADLATVKARVVAESLRQHLLCTPAPPHTGPDTATQHAYSELVELGADCDRLAEFQHEAGQAAATLKGISQRWADARWLHGPLRRRTTADPLGPRSIVGRAALMEDISLRPTPLNGRIDVRVEVTDADFFSIARFAGVMSVVLMSVVLAFLVISAARHSRGGSEPSPEVLAGALTLFSAIQAGRIDHPDRSTLRGLLSASGNWLIVASILPTIVLAVALAFGAKGWAPVRAAGIAIAFQIALQLFMARPRRARRTGKPRRRQHLWTSTPPDYARLGVLRSSWWRTTTADALKLGRQARGYIVWEHGDTPSLTRLLVEARQDSPPAAAATTGATRRLFARLGPLLASQSGGNSGAVDDGGGLVGERPANILALLRGSTARQALTFIVFREQPASDWASGLDVRPVRFDPDRLAPMENAPDSAEIFLSVPCPGDWPALAHHPIPAVLEAAADQRLIVLETNLPVPPPGAEYRDQTWARIRIGLRDAEIRRLPGFSRAVKQRIGKNRWMLPCDVLVRTTSGSGLRVIVQAHGPRTGPGTAPDGSRLVRASDMDVVAPVTRIAGRGLASPSQADWRVLALCADAQAGIDADILGSLGRRWPGMRLAGLDHAVLHGMTVMLIVAHQPDGRSGRQDEMDALTQQYADAHATILVDEWQTAEQLGQGQPEPLLRVNIRGPDQPGMILDTLESLYATLAESLPAQGRPAA